MRIMQRGVDMAERCWDMESRLYGKEGGALVGVVVQFKYLRRPLDHDDWSEIFWNIKRARKVWG